MGSFSSLPKTNIASALKPFEISIWNEFEGIGPITKYFQKRLTKPKRPDDSNTVAKIFSFVVAGLTSSLKEEASKDIC